MTEAAEASELAALRSIVEGTATETGEGFFAALVENLKSAMGTMGAWVAVYDEASHSLRAIAMKMGDRSFEGFSYVIEGTPCQTVLDERRLLHVPERMVELYSVDQKMLDFGPVSYMGVPLFDVDQRIIGHLAVLDGKPMPDEPRGLAIFRIFASRAAAELRRLERDRALRERENQLSRLLESAMDAIVTLDDELRVCFINPAAERVFDCEAGSAVGSDFGALLAPDARRALSDHMAELVQRKQETASLWIPGGLRAVTCRGRTFRAEATLSHFTLDRRHWFTLILRDLEERLAAEKRIQSLLNEAESLREELRSLGAFEPILGSSPALLSALREVERVAAIDTTVLLLGETGTGKELFARALHSHSRRSAARLVKVNCGAIPKDLIESELFGHEKGAFTGATARREGRFAMAHGGTIFLDEIGELPLELQPKLLRVLQEGEFDPVGSSRTVKVDVRVVAATHRNLPERVSAGTFREDLFYRLNVFPIRIPPLRERGEDVVELAHAFVERFSRRMGRAPLGLSAQSLEKLRGHPWPGNVRELANVIERGVITATGGTIDIERALSQAAPEPCREVERVDTETRIYTALELEALERANIERALEAAGWKVSGDGGAGALLGLNPSTLSSRMRALGIRRPRRD